MAGKMKRIVQYLLGLIILSLVVSVSAVSAGEGKTDNSADWFYPEWAAKAKYNTSVAVWDTDSALGRYSTTTKEIGLKDLARIHGHLCDGLVISYIEIKAVLNKLFPDGKVDRTDLRVVSKNGPCWVDAVSFMTGARINFQTLRIDASVGDGFIIQKISTGEAYSVHLKPGVFPAEQAKLESKIRKARSQGQNVSARDIDIVEGMADDLSKRLLNTPPDEILTIKSLPEYRFAFNDMFGGRGDIVNKNMPR
ncbi:MAG: FmdE, Molybdenum formylmethanofuran dehydrogenase operon [Syntrophus sp. PtaB.Bin001]|nr:MAG: FmdE, Molybdenum formylmethanofuran dehydrogenase operon [Syntrophus sp. PtaB.Bin001]